MSDDRVMRRLALTAEFLSDLERVRIANDNRIRALRDDLDAGDEREAQTSVRLAEVFATAEHAVELDLKRILRQTDLGVFVQRTVGLGEKQVARLLGTIGHPRWRYDNEADEWHPRTVGQLWSYCGYSVVPAGGQLTSDTHVCRAPGVAPARRRGQQAAYNTEARTRAFLIAESCIKQIHSPYRKVYDDGRAKYAETVHKADCVRCGPSGHPAKVGSPLSDGHKHARALRLVAKTVLKDLWIAAEPSAVREPNPRALAA